ncbi:MAG: hypothetical protein MUC90_08545 [Thermoplasmata archaeon]|nr:hypothetical protein [Thermoplasmata archaeon]
MSAEDGEAKWDLKVSGPEQLRELNAMERNQDRSYWASTAIFVTANAVAAAVFFQQESHYLARTAIGMVGLLITLTWFLIAIRSHQYESMWGRKAAELEKALGVDSRYAIWSDKPKGISSWYAILMAISGFMAFWIVGTAIVAFNLMI